MKKLSFAASTAGSPSAAPKQAGGSSSSPVTSAAGSTRRLSSTSQVPGRNEHDEFMYGGLMIDPDYGSFVYTLNVEGGIRMRATSGLILRGGSSSSWSTNSTKRTCVFRAAMALFSSTTRTRRSGDSDRRHRDGKQGRSSELAMEHR
jgi:hypothetical protein